MGNKGAMVGKKLTAIKIWSEEREGERPTVGRTLKHIKGKCR